MLNKSWDYSPLHLGSKCPSRFWTFRTVQVAYISESAWRRFGSLRFGAGSIRVVHGDGEQHYPDWDNEAAILWHYLFGIIKYIFRPEGPRGEKGLIRSIKRVSLFGPRAEDISRLVWKPVGYGSNIIDPSKNGPSRPARGVVHGDGEQHYPDWDNEAATFDIILGRCPSG